MFHVYTFGKESRQFLILTPKQAKTLNDFEDCFALSQEIYLEQHGHPWNPIVDPTIMLYIPDDDPQLVERRDKIVRFCNLQHKIRNRIFDLFRIDVSEEEFDIHLVKKF